MRATIDGVELDGTPIELAEFIRSYQAESVPQDLAMLTRKQRALYDALALHANGAHYLALADEMPGTTEAAVGAMLNDLVHKHEGKLIRRICAGTYAVVR